MSNFWVQKRQNRTPEQLAKGSKLDTWVALQHIHIYISEKTQLIPPGWVVHTCSSSDTYPRTWHALIIFGTLSLFKFDAWPFIHGMANTSNHMWLRIHKSVAHSRSRHNISWPPEKVSTFWAIHNLSSFCLCHVRTRIDRTRIEESGWELWRENQEGRRERSAMTFSVPSPYWCPFFIKLFQVVGVVFVANDSGFGWYLRTERPQHSTLGPE